MIPARSWTFVDAKPLAVLGDSVTHRPHLARRLDSRKTAPQGSFLKSNQGGKKSDFNSYGSRRPEIMK